MPFGVFLKKGMKLVEAGQTASAVVAQVKREVAAEAPAPELKSGPTPSWAVPKPKYPYLVGNTVGKKYLQVNVIKEDVDTKGRKVVVLQVVRQSHFCDNFGKSGRYFDASNGYRLASSGVPGFYEVGSVYLQGGDGSSASRKSIPLSDLPKVEQAVKEYNEYFKDSLDPEKEKSVKPTTEPAKKECKFKVGDRVIGKGGGGYFITKKGWVGMVVAVRNHRDDIQIKAEGDTTRYWFNSKDFDLYTPPEAKTKSTEYGPTLTEHQRTSSIDGGGWKAKSGDVIEGTETGVIVKILSIDKDSKGKLTKCTVGAIEGQPWYKDKETGKEFDRKTPRGNKSIRLYKLVCPVGTPFGDAKEFDPYNPQFKRASTSAGNRFLNYKVMGVVSFDGISKVRFKITEQFNFRSFTASDKFTLCSVNCPDIMESPGYILVAPAEMFLRFANAVKEYNEKYNK